MSKKKKYVTVSISGIITQIAKKSDIEGYTEGIFEIFFPEEDELSEDELSVWIEENNKRMLGICEFLNENNL